MVIVMKKEPARAPRAGYPARAAATAASVCPRKPMRHDPRDNQRHRPIDAANSADPAARNSLYAQRMSACWTASGHRLRRPALAAQPSTSAVDDPPRDTPWIASASLKWAATHL